MGFFFGLKNGNDQSPRAVLSLASWRPRAVLSLASWRVAQALIDILSREKLLLQSIDAWLLQQDKLVNGRISYSSSEICRDPADPSSAYSLRSAGARSPIRWTILR